MIDTRHGISSTSSAPTRPTPGRAPVAQPDQAAAPAATGGEVSLSERGRSLQALEQAVVSADTRKADRVAEVRAQVADGSYQVDTMQLAGKLLQSDWSRW